MILSAEQRRRVEENMGLVGKVIKDKVHDTNRCGIYTYDDLYQIGCLGLCKAAATDKGGTFSTYAYRLIWNEICDALIYANRRNETVIAVIYDALAYRAGNELDGSKLLWDTLCSTDSILYPELKVTIEEAQKNAAPTIQKGIEAQVAIFGENMRDFHCSGSEESKHINHWLTDNCFGDYYTRNGLDYRQREMITFCFLAAQGGCEPQLVSHVQANIKVGNDKEFLIKVVSQCLPYIGYPRSLNALNCINKAVK